MFAGQPSAPEVAACVVLGCAAAMFGALTRRCAPRRFHPRAPWLRLAANALLSLAREAPRVALALLRRPQGGIARQPFDPGGDAPAERSRRALVVLKESVAPNSYVLAVTTDALVLHRLAPDPARISADRRWTL